MTKKTLSILIPCHNEEENIPYLLMNIPKIKSSEIILIDDGSKDNTRNFAKSQNIKNIKVVSYKNNKGKGHAIKKGLQHSKGDYAIILDADMNPKEIPKLIKPLLDGKADFINGTRFKERVSLKDMDLIHQIGNKIFAFLISVKINEKITDSLCGFKAFPTERFKYSLEENTWMDFELLIKAKYYGYRIKEIPIKYKGRIRGLSKMNTYRDAYTLFTHLFKYTTKTGYQYGIIDFIREIKDIIKIIIFR